MKIIESKMESVDNLDYAEWNYKKPATMEEKEKFKNSLLKNGFLYGLIIAQRGETPNDDTWEVCDGNHRLEIIRELKLKQIPTYKMGRLSLKERMRLAIELNEWKFKINAISLSDCFKVIGEKFDNLVETLPFSQEKIDELTQLYNYSPTMFQPPADEYDRDLTEESSPIIVTFKDAQYRQVTKCFNLYLRKHPDATMQEMIIQIGKEYLNG